VEEPQSAGRGLLAGTSAGPGGKACIRPVSFNEPLKGTHVTTETSKCNLIMKLAPTPAACLILLAPAQPAPRTLALIRAMVYVPPQNVVRRQNYVGGCQLGGGHRPCGGACGG
jgi:hypothetical protein